MKIKTTGGFLAIGITIVSVLALCLPAPAAGRADTPNTGIPAADTVTVENDYPIIAEQMPSFDGGDINTFHKWVVPRVKYPITKLMKGVSGRVVVTFVVDENGSVVDVKALSSPDRKLAKAVIKAVKKSPRWEPGRNAGKPVAVLQTLPVIFGMPMGDDDEALADNEKMPRFMGGGIDYFARWISMHIKYPFAAYADEIEGTVVVSFVIDKDGSVVNVQIRESPHESLSKEAIRVVKSSPKWTPGQRDGKPVKVILNLPVNFSIPEDHRPSNQPPTRVYL